MLEEAETNIKGFLEMDKRYAFEELLAMRVSISRIRRAHFIPSHQSRPFKNRKRLKDGRHAEFACIQDTLVL
jgi:hypothetical protein